MRSDGPMPFRLMLAFGAALGLAGSPSAIRATEVTVQNDSLVPGGTGSIQAGFTMNESAAAWLTSPCDGTIVAVQVFWRSLFGGEPQSLEESITIYNGIAADFPLPDIVLALLEGPVMNDGVLNEFRYLDEQQTIPLSVPVFRDQVFIVSFRFANSPNPFIGPSVVTDLGCQQGKNTIFAIPGGWLNACSVGISGDFVIRAVVDCPEQQGACCLPNGTCQIRTQTQCQNQGGTYRGNGTTCTAGICDGACCHPDGSCTQANQGACTSGGGAFQGVLVACTTGLCEGACCLPSGGCSNSQTANSCAVAGGAFKGTGSTCGGVTCSGACCYNNGSCQQQTLAQCGGVWNGPSSNCGTTNCPARGACCLPDGGCLNNQLASECASMGGVYKGDNTTCAANSCVGACCFGGSCLNLTKSDCQQISSSVWQGPAYLCAGGNTCPSGACCLPLGDCAPATTPVNCAGLGGVFHNGQTCAQANCPVPLGACCFNNGGSCISSLQPQQCALISGSTWKGSDSICARTCCPPPRGDFTADALLNGADIQPFVAALLGSPTDVQICRGDFNENALLDAGDIPGLVTALLIAP
jgi:hypothetical protein